MALRKHQESVVKICHEIISGEPINMVYLDCHPGSGKSGDSVLFAKHLLGNGFDKICHVAPRKSLVGQIEEDMLDPFFNAGKTIRVADNGPNPSRGLDGFGITFQAIASNSENIIADFKKYRYILVVDEHHHCSDDGSWEEPLKELVRLAGLTVFMTGTAFRGDGGPISFFPYKDNKLDKTESKNVRWVTYTRTDALEEHAILPVKFNLIDGSGSYLKKGQRVDYETITREHLKYAINSDYSYQVIDADMGEFLEYKKTHPKAQMILVGMSIEVSRNFADYISKKWCKCISVDSEMVNSSDIIKRFRHGEFDVLSSCGQAYEGLDAPHTSHMIILTNIRSEPWLIQCVNRATRAKDWKDFAYITAPADPDFQKFFKNWIWEQEKVLEEQEDKPEKKKKKGNNQPKPDVTILSGEAHLPPSAKEKIIREELNTLINSYVGKQSMKNIGGINKAVHTESMRRRKILWMKVYLAIGRKCQLKEMTYEEMEKALETVKKIIEFS
ncbi:MAG: DEAD/DEAH box helicase family protein [Spirochaetales bacterium]|nr:DEAD/DEAH box helicase family protein [Spirochaetales bacterium]